MLPLMLIALATMESGAQDTGEAEHAYIGSKKCKKCHLKQYKSWAETRMANAFELLKPGGNIEKKEAAGLDPQKDYTTDETCLPCHVTGYGQKGGFVDLESTPHLAGVGCEMCHGAGGTYVQDQLMSSKNKRYKKPDIVAAGMVDTVSKDQCVGCHNTDSPFVGGDYVFDFEKRKAEGTHEHFPLKYEH
jgi:hypothetical protein